LVGVGTEAAQQLRRRGAGGPQPPQRVPALAEDGLHGVADLRIEPGHDLAGDVLAYDREIGRDQRGGDQARLHVGRLGGVSGRQRYGLGEVIVGVPEMVPG
jgi:hypothetical protein